MHYYIWIYRFRGVELNCWPESKKHYTSRRLQLPKYTCVDWTKQHVNDSTPERAEQQALINVATANLSQIHETQNKQKQVWLTIKNKYDRQSKTSMTDNQKQAWLTIKNKYDRLSKTSMIDNQKQVWLTIKNRYDWQSKTSMTDNHKYVYRW